MLEENKRIAEITGIDKWRDKGYLGQGIKVAFFDRDFKDTSEAQKLFNNKLNFAGGYGETDDLSSHGSLTSYTFHQFLPEAEIWILPPLAESLQWCIDNNMDGINVSMGLAGASRFPEEADEAESKGITLVASAGNSSEERRLLLPARKKDFVGVGAVHLRNPDTRDEEIVRARYSQYTEEEKEVWEMVEVMAFSGIHLLSPHPDASGYIRPFSMTGTSISGPMFLVKAMLLKQARGKLNQEELRGYIQEYSKEMGDTRKYGSGLFILPDPQEVEVMPVIDFNLNTGKAYIDGTEIEIDVPAQVIEGRTMIPLRFVAENMGIEVDYDKEKHMARVGGRFK